jgi:hypothetical protein
VSDEIDWADPRGVAAIFNKDPAEARGPQKRTEARNVFAVDRSQWSKACDRGLGVAASYLVLGCHTRGSTGLTTASANAIENLVGIHHRFASKYIAAMESVGLLERIDGRANARSHPLYRLPMPAKPELVWLPNAIVRGSDVPPLKLLWHMQDVNALRYFVDLYASNHLPTDGGISRGVLRLPFERHEVGRAGELVVWGFRQGALRAVGRPDQAKFFETFSGLGFLGQVPHLFLSDDPDASIIHPYGTEQTHSFEDMIGIAAHHAGLALISEERRQFVQAEKLWLAPVPPDIPRVAMVGIARLRYQPETQTTVDWQRHLVENAPGFIAKYERVSGSASRPPSQLRLGLFP